MSETLESLNDALARFQANESESDYGLQLDGSLSISLDVTIYHVPVKDEQGEATGQFTDKCFVQVSGGFEPPLKGFKDEDGQLSGFIEAYLNYDNDPLGKQGIYLEDFLNAFKIDRDAKVWSLADAE